MGHKPNSIILDSWSVTAYLEDETAGRRVADLITEATRDCTALLMTAISAGEVWYIFARGTSEIEADQAIAEIESLGIEFVDVDWKLAESAARFKARYKMSYADGFAAALSTREKGAILVTGDKEFKRVEKEVKILWLNG